MKKQDQLLHLKEVLSHLQEASVHLAVSVARCKALEREPNVEDGLIEYEALTSRFARLADILIHKVYRSIDAVEFVNEGTLVDVMNRAEKRQLIDSIQEMRAIKDLRNDIAHEYLPQRLKLLHEEVLQRAPKLLELIERVQGYCQKYI